PYANDLVPLSFEVHDFSTTPSTDNAYDFHAQAGTGATLDWSGSISVTPLFSKGRFRFANVRIPAHWTYVRESVGFDVTSGIASFDGDYDLYVSEGGTRFKANLREFGINELAIRRFGQDLDVAHFTNVTATNASFDLEQHAAGVEKILVDGGSVIAWRDAEGKINLTELAQPADESPPPAAEPASTAAPAAAPAEPSSPFTFTAPDIEAKGLVVQVEDRQVEPTIKRMLDPFNLRVTGYSTAPGTTIGIKSDAKIDKSADLSADL